MFAMKKTPALLALMLAVAVACSQDGADRLTLEERSGGRAGSWQPLPGSPLSPRHEALSFAVDGLVLIVGGRDTRPCPAGADCAGPRKPPLRDGAAFDPRTGTWTAIEDAPVPLGSASGTVLGDTLYLWVSGFADRPTAQPAFLAYHAEDDRWEELPLPPGAEGLLDHHLVAAGEVVVAYSGSQENGVLPDLIYDPAGGTWAELGPDPLTPSFDRTLVWTGEELVLLGIADVPNPGAEEPALYRAATIDLSTGHWSDSVTSEIVGWNPVWFWAGQQVVNPTIGSADGGGIGNWGREYPFGGTFDPRTGDWSSLPNAPSRNGDYVGVSAGDETVLVSAEGWVLDLATGRWTSLPRPPSAAEDGEAVVVAYGRL